MKNILIEQFKKIFPTAGKPEVYFAPGRVNIIGEHIDYNGGFVFPTTINLGTYAAMSPRHDNIIRFRSMNYPLAFDIELDHTEYQAAHEWANYPKGVLHFLKDTGKPMTHGFDVLFYGNLPVGAGLSSSASIEMVTAVMLKDLYQLNLPMIELVKIGQRTENEYLNLSSGIMDQFAIGFGKKNQAICLNTNTLEYKYIPLKLQGHQLVIANTNKKRSLVDSKYNERYNECMQALEILNKNIKANALCEITADEFEKNSYLIKDSVLARRAWHVIYENQRTKFACDFLQQHDLKAFGQLLNQSHVSLKKDYEVSGFELDTLVELAWKQKGVLGARMTGAGFGGCTINLIKTEFVQAFIENVGKEYQLLTGLQAEFYPVNSVDGAQKLD